MIEFEADTGAIIRYLEKRKECILTDGQTITMEWQAFWRKLKIMRQSFRDTGQKYAIRQLDDLADHLTDNADKLD